MSDFFKDRRVVVTGGAGFLGGYVCEGLRRRGCRQVLVPTIDEYDLVRMADVERMYDTLRPEVVIHLAAVVGGIGDIRGAFYGGFLLGFIEVGVVTVFPSTYRDLFAFTILLIILWMKPTGLFGMPQSTKI